MSHERLSPSGSVRDMSGGEKLELGWPGKELGPMYSIVSTQQAQKAHGGFTGGNFDLYDAEIWLKLCALAARVFLCVLRLIVHLVGWVCVFCLHVLVLLYFNHLIV